MIIKHVKKGEIEVDRKELGIDEILELFGENRETAFVIINGKPATSDKKAKEGDDVLVISAVSGG